MLITNEEIKALEGILPTIQEQTIELNRIFNTNDLDRESKTSQFIVPEEVTVLEGTGAEAVGGACGTYALACVGAGETSITADYPLALNTAFPKCLTKMTREAVMQISKRAVISYQNKVATYGLGQLSLNATVVASADTTVKGKIIDVVKELTAQGVARSEIVVLLNEDLYYDAMKEEIACCDLGVQAQATNSVLGNKLGVKEIIVIPANIMAGVTDKFEVMAYPVMLAPLKHFCETPVSLVSFRDGDRIGETSKLEGMGFYKVQMLEVLNAPTDKTKLCVKITDTVVI